MLLTKLPTQGPCWVLLKRCDEDDEPIGIETHFFRSDQNPAEVFSEQAGNVVLVRAYLGEEDDFFSLYTPETLEKLAQTERKLEKKSQEDPFANEQPYSWLLEEVFEEGIRIGMTHAKELRPLFAAEEKSREKF